MYVSFLSTLSLRRATRKSANYVADRLFLSTLSLRRATPAVVKLQPVRNGISIHALLAESDFTMASPIAGAQSFLSTLSLRRATAPAAALLFSHCNFYPRSPCGERHRFKRPQAGRSRFLSTLSLRRATRQFRSSCKTSAYFYPRSPCGERPVISPSTPPMLSVFLSTLSLRRATDGKEV